MMDPQAVRKILVVRNDRFGEFLLNIPALRALRETYPSALITAVVSEAVFEIAGCVPFIDEALVWATGQPLRKKIGFLTFLRRKKMDLAVVLNPSKELHILTYLADIPLRAGYNRKWGFLLTHKMQDLKALARKHEVEYNLELVGLIGASTRDLSLGLNLDECAIQDDLFTRVGIEHGVEYIAIHPWTSDPVKQWPLENFRELAKKIAGTSKIKVIIVGGKAESTKSKDIFGVLDESVIDLTGMTTLKQLAALLKKCSLLVSGDSGPVHLACSVGTAVVALFRSDIQGKSAKRWGPWAKNCAVIEKNSLADITVEEVWDKIRESVQ